MKKITFLLAMLCCGIAQSQSYDFSVHTESYADLSNAISLNDGELWDDPDYVIPIGFDFEVGDNTYSTLSFFSYGAGGALSTDVNEDYMMILLPIAQDIEDRGSSDGNSQSPISYKLDGTADQQILKIEWKNVGFWDDSTAADFMSFQVWLYEGTNIIEYRYGPNSINNPASFEEESGPITAFLPAVNFATEEFIEPGYFLTGDPANPTAEVVDGNNGPTGTLNEAIPSGTVYRFTPENTTSVEDFVEMDFKIYPNPATNHIIVSEVGSTTFKIDIYNTLGQKVRTIVGVEGRQTDISNLS